MSGPSRRDAIRLAGRVAGLGAAALASVIRPARAVEVPLAIKGYDPVAYFTLGVPTRGLPDISLEWDEHLYRFSIAEHRDMFRADPVRFAPQFANYCAMSLARGEIEEANPDYWLIRDGKLYLFGKPVGPELFQQNYAGNVARAGENGWMVKRR